MSFKNVKASIRMIYFVCYNGFLFYQKSVSKTNFRNVHGVTEVISHMLEQKKNNVEIAESHYDF